MATTKGAATRTRILDATVEALVRGGRENVNLDHVLASTRTSKGQLFHYFPGGKQELIRVATQRQLQRVALEATATLDTLDKWQEWIDGIVGLHRMQTRDDACEVAALAGRILDPDPEERSLLGAQYSSWHRRLAADIETMKDNGQLRADADAAALAALFVACLQGGAVLDKATQSLDYLEPALFAALAHLHNFASSAKDSSNST